MTPCCSELTQPKLEIASTGVLKSSHFERRQLAPQRHAELNIASLGPLSISFQALTVDNVPRAVRPRSTCAPLVHPPTTAISCRSSSCNPSPRNSHHPSRCLSIIQHHCFVLRNTQPSPQWLPKTTKEAPLP